MKVCKFGGTSMANAECIKRVRDIVLGDDAIKCVVVSAPGKRESGDTKVTDLLYACYDKVNGGENPDVAFKPIEDRFDSIISDLKLDVDFSGRYREIKTALRNGASRDYAASRGEFLSALVLAELIGWPCVDAKDFVCFDEKGNFLSEETDEKAKAVFKRAEKAVVPGFYGAAPDGSVKTFSRGGSDITGAIAARALYADIYENWTDVDGFMKCDPRLVDNPEVMELITYKELRELSYMGANVLHPDSIFPVRKKDIPIHIRNTFNPSAKGTMIVPSKKFFLGAYDRQDSTVIGIAGKKDFVAINIEKSMMNNELGFARKVLEIIEKNGLCIEHMPSGIDTLSVIIDGSGHDGAVFDRIVEEIKSVCHPDTIDIDRNLALIAVVGHGMSRKKGTATKVFNSLFKADINIRMIDQGSSELNIIIGVENNEDYENAIKALYAEFLSE